MVLLIIPAEIRERILRDLLCEPHTIEYHARVRWKNEDSFRAERLEREEREKASGIKESAVIRRYKWRDWGNGRPDLALLRTCRQLYMEGWTLLLKHNQYVISGFIDRMNNSPETDGYLGSMTLQQTFRVCPRLMSVQDLKIKIHTPEVRWGRGHYNRWCLTKIPWQLSRFCHRFKNIKITFEGGGFVHNPRLVHYKAVLHQFGLIRAQKARFCNMLKTCALDLEAVVQSNSPVVDLCLHVLAVAHFMRLIFQLKRFANFGSSITEFFSQRTPDFHALIEAMLAWNIELSSRLEGSFLDVCLRWLNQIKELADDPSAVWSLIQHGRSLQRRHEFGASLLRNKNTPEGYPCIPCEEDFTVEDLKNYHRDLLGHHPDDVCDAFMNNDDYQTLSYMSHAYVVRWRLDL